MSTRLFTLIVSVVLATALVGCAQAKPTTTDGATTPPQETTATPPAGGPATGTSLAPGLYDQPDGTVMALGTLQHLDLEGGFWAVIDGTQAENNVGHVAAVIANAGKFRAQTEQLKGLSVVVIGKRLDGASIRMAGPEIDATSIKPATDVGGPAE